jgi:hypothetical protein
MAVSHHIGTLLAVLACHRQKAVAAAAKPKKGSAQKKKKAESSGGSRERIRQVAATKGLHLQACLLLSSTLWYCGQ